MFDARDERNSSDLPSGYHSATTSAPGWNVSRFGSPPAYGIVYASALPSYSAVNATVLPSGESFGNNSWPSCVVSRCATPPARGSVHRSPAYTNTMWSPWMSGWRMSRHSSSAAAFRGTNAAHASASAGINRRRMRRARDGSACMESMGGTHPPEGSRLGGQRNEQCPERSAGGSRPAPRARRRGPRTRRGRRLKSLPRKVDNRGAALPRPAHGGGWRHGGEPRREAGRARAEQATPSARRRRARRPVRGHWLAAAR